MTATRFTTFISDGPVPGVTMVVFGGRGVASVRIGPYNFDFDINAGRATGGLGGIDLAGQGKRTGKRWAALLAEFCTELVTFNLGPESEEYERIITEAGGDLAAVEDDLAQQVLWVSEAR